MSDEMLLYCKLICEEWDIPEVFSDIVEILDYFWFATGGRFLLGRYLDLDWLLLPL